MPLSPTAPQSRCVCEHSFFISGVRMYAWLCILMCISYCILMQAALNLLYVVTGCKSVLFKSVFRGS